MSDLYAACGGVYIAGGAEEADRSGLYCLFRRVQLLLPPARQCPYMMGALKPQADSLAGGEVA